MSESKQESMVGNGLDKYRDLGEEIQEYRNDEYVFMLDRGNFQLLKNGKRFYVHVEEPSESTWFTKDEAEAVYEPGPVFWQAVAMVENWLQKLVTVLDQAVYDEIVASLEVTAYPYFEFLPQYQNTFVRDLAVFAVNEGQGDRFVHYKNDDIISDLFKYARYRVNEADKDELVQPDVNEDAR